LPAVVPVESEVEESAEVDGGGSDRQGDPVAVDASAAAVAVGDEPGNGSFDHRPLLSVVVNEGDVVVPACLVGCEVLAVFADGEGLAFGRCGAAGSEGAGVASFPEACGARRGDVGSDVVGAGDGAGGVVDAEVVPTELVVAEVRVPAAGPGFDQDPMFGVVECGEGVAGAQ
jgi:hypothetical protein